MPGAESPYDVTHAFTVKNARLAAAILNGDKECENRTQAISKGWHAVHIGLAKESPSDTLSTHVREQTTDEQMALIADAIEKGRAPKGSIVGLCRIAHALPVESLKDCGWAMGPVCMIIAETLWLERPVPHSGQLGTWPIGSLVLPRITTQIGRCAISVWPHAETYPADPAALLKMREEKRAEKREAKRKRDDSA